MSVSIKKTRGRKKKDIAIDPPVSTIEIVADNANANANNVKRRGRKPKGGKLIQKSFVENENAVQISNIILHLRCSLKDLVSYTTKLNPLEYNPNVPPEIMAYDSQLNKRPFCAYELNTNEVTPPTLCDSVAYTESHVCIKCKSNEKKVDIDMDETNEVNEKDLNVKLKKLRINFYKNANALSEKKSACFWCTYEFDNPACFIPKYEMNDEIVGYGSFCRPECAVGYLMRENLDDSTKFERYFILNQVYAKVYGFKKNIKPAPDPHFLLDKFYGNLSIQEYRKLLRTENILTIMEKPMTRILPEIHEDNDEFILNIYGGTKQIPKNNTGVYRVKRQSEKQQGPSKMDIMKDKFGM